MAICDLACLGCPFRIFQIFAVLIFFCLGCIWFWGFRVYWFCGFVDLLVLMATLLLGLVRDSFSRGLNVFDGLVDLGFRFCLLGFCCYFDLLGFGLVVLVLELLVWCRLWVFEV